MAHFLSTARRWIIARRRRRARSAADPPLPRREIEEGRPIVQIGVAALVLSEGDAAFGAGLVDRRIGVADEPRHAEQAVDRRSGAGRLPGAARVDPGIVVETAGSD